ncbi:MAG TPA: hypothetical protein VFV64_15840 [Permianibacter sp.]|nr:hypothetical protein [Permianibacter sp.]
MNSTNLFRVALAFAAGLFVIAFTYFTLIRPFWENSRGGEMVMRSYVVHGDHADEVRSALQAALRGTEDDKSYIGRVTLAPNGQLIVTAPESVHRGVKSLIDDVLAYSPGPTPTIKLEAWFVRGSAGVAGADPTLTEVQPALTAIAEAQGINRFQLIEKLTIHARAGHEGDVQGAQAALRAEPTLRRAGKDEAAVFAKLSLWLNRNGARLNAEMEMKPGELLVLGQSAYSSDGAPTSDNQTLYYIVRATL